jgi:hypothetical protein
VRIGPFHGKNRGSNPLGRASPLLFINIFNPLGAVNQSGSRRLAKLVLFCFAMALFASRFLAHAALRPAGRIGLVHGAGVHERGRIAFDATRAVPDPRFIVLARSRRFVCSACGSRAVAAPRRS